MPEISGLTLVLSDKCNFSCPYCPQRKGKNVLPFEDIKTFLDFLQPRLAKEVWLGFYGGEPLLSWPLIERTVPYLLKKNKNKSRFTLTTNGSLLTKEHILFFKKNRFELVLSYDGLAQKYRDAGSVAAVETALENLLRLYPEGYTVNSVFSPQTIGLLAWSIKSMLKQGHRRLQYALDQTAPWQDADLEVLEEQLNRLADSCLDHWRKSRSVPLESFAGNDSKGIFACFAGRDRLALLPDRSVWGCDMFHTLLGNDPRDPEYAKYCFGELEEFVSKPARKLSAIAAHYAELRQDFFFSDKKELCSLCNDLESCSMCPATAALATGTLAVFPSWTCELKKLGRRARAGFVAEQGKRGRPRRNVHA